MRAGMLREAQQRELNRTLVNALGARGKGKEEQNRMLAAELSRDWARGYDVKERIEECFRGTPYSLDSVAGKVFANHLEQLEKIERMIDTVMRRQDGLIRKIDRRRDVFARRVQEMKQDILEGKATEQADSG